MPDIWATTWTGLVTAWGTALAISHQHQFAVGNAFTCVPPKTHSNVYVTHAWNNPNGYQEKAIKPSSKSDGVDNRRQNISPVVVQLLWGLSMVLTLGSPRLTEHTYLECGCV